MRLNQDKSLKLKKLILLISVGLIGFSFSSQKGSPSVSRIDNVIDGVLFESGNWETDLRSGEKGISRGNHRAVIVANPESGTMRAHIPWRRRDTDPQKKDVILVDSRTGKELQNCHILKLNNMSADILFTTEGADTFYLYYFPYETTGSYYPTVNYLTPENQSNAAWQSKAIRAKDEFPEAEVIAIQSIDGFHSFFPMEIIASPEEVADFTKSQPAEFTLFTKSVNVPARVCL